MNRKNLLFALVVLTTTAFFLAGCNRRQEKTSSLDYGNPDTGFHRAARAKASPYALFGDSSTVLHTETERWSKQVLEIIGTDRLGQMQTLEFRSLTGEMRVYGKDKQLLQRFFIGPEQMARFLSPDRFADKYPAMNPYNYAGNNPMSYIDPSGDSIQPAGTAAALNSMQEVINTGLEGYYTASINSTGMIQLTATGKEGSLSDRAKNFYSVLNAAVSDPKTVSINVYNHSDKASHDVVVGDIASHAIDIGDIQAFGTGGKLTAQGALIHEIKENHVVQAKGYTAARDIAKAHLAATAVENLVTGTVTDPINRPVSGNTITVPYKTNPSAEAYDGRVIINLKKGNVTSLSGN